MKKILITILTACMGFSLFAAETNTGQIIVNGVDFTEFNSVGIPIMNWEQRIKYYKENKSKIDAKLKLLQLNTKEYSLPWFKGKNKTVIPYFIAALLSVNYAECDNDLNISDINAIYLFATNYIEFNKSGLTEQQALENVLQHKNDFGVYYLAYIYKRCKCYDELRQIKDQLPFNLVYANKNDYIKYNIFSEEEIYDLLTKQQTLTDEQKTFRNELFVKLYQKKMLGK